MKPAGNVELPVAPAGKIHVAPLANVPVGSFITHTPRVSGQPAIVEGGVSSAVDHQLRRNVSDE